MGRTATPQGRPVNGPNVAAYDAAVFEAYGRTCHLCGRPAADTVDHLITVKADPSMRWVVSNGRPAHRSCNSERGAGPVPATWRAASW